MKVIAAREAKNQFGNLMDSAQREPITIEKHGRAVAVLMSIEEYKQIKQVRLQSEVMAGLRQLEAGESTVFDKDELKALFEGIKTSRNAH